ncbi:MAG: haloacid dehalogenase [Dehalococcoidales bacterium]|nr:haloacid dehalogenase [Dehalococcoidales bacterium]
MSNLERLDEIAGKARLALQAKDGAREKALPLCREAVRCCSTAIRAIHRQEMEPARELLGEALKRIKEAEQTVAGYPEFSGASFVRDAWKEYAEGNITLAIVTGAPLPAPDELGVESSAYLNGMGEAAGELRRYLLDSMRKGDLSRGEDLLTAMDDIYSVLVAMDFPDGITGGLRHTTDMVRGVLEKSRSDLTLAMRQKDLEQRLDKLEKELH